MHCSSDVGSNLCVRMGNIPSSRDDEHAQAHLTPHDVRLAVTEILTLAGATAYHSSVIVDNREYYFDSVGIMIAPPLWSHLVGQAKHPGNMKTEVIDIGRSSNGGKAMAGMFIGYPTVHGDGTDSTLSSTHTFHGTNDSSVVRTHDGSVAPTADGRRKRRPHGQRNRRPHG